ncbi:MAG: hypothetical protein QOC99_2660 [Acidobacteriota bacterium]|nr:hypothetical protein [Acidobacteriota bacterium]
MRAARVACLALSIVLLSITSCAQTKTDGNKKASAANNGDAQAREDNSSGRQRPLPDRQANVKEPSTEGGKPTPRPVTPLVADPDTPNISGPDHALLEAVRRSDLNAVQSLLKLKGVNLNVRQNGTTPLLLAVSEQEPGARGAEILKLLLENGADIKVRNSQNETALYLAAERARPDEVRLLLEHKADPNAPIHDPSKKETVMSLVRAKLREQPKEARLVEIEKLLATAAGRVK